MGSPERNISAEQNNKVGRFGSGFDNFRIVDYENSFNAFQLYSHYLLIRVTIKINEIDLRFLSFFKNFFQK